MNKQDIRTALSNDIARFLKQGGAIATLPAEAGKKYAHEKKRIRKAAVRKSLQQREFETFVKELDGRAVK